MRRIASGIGVEKTYLIHSPNVIKVEVTKRSKVRRNNLSYMRALTGKSARLTGVDFDKKAVNTIPEEEKPAKTEETVKEDVESEAPVEEAVAEKAEAEATEEMPVAELDTTEEPAAETEATSEPKAK